MAVNFTRWAYRLHRWIGLGGAVFVFIIAVTGAILVFRSEIDRLMIDGAPIQAPGTPLALDAIAERLNARHPDLILSSIQFPVDAYARRIGLHPMRSGARLAPEEHSAGC